MNNMLPISLFVALCLITGCAESSGVRPVIKMSYGLDFEDAQQRANLECRKLNARSAKLVKEERDYTFECVETASAAEEVPIVEVPITGHRPLD